MQLGACENFYLVCANPRVGSTLFCEVLRGTGVAGCVTEPFDPNVETRLRQEWGCQTVSRLEFMVEAIKMSRTPNGVGAAKIMWTYLDAFLTDLAKFENLRALPSGIERFATTFRGCLALHLSRRNKAQAAISYWLARETGEWFWDGSTPRGQPPARPDFWEITKLHAEMHAAELSWPLFLRAAGIRSATIYYEDWVLDPAKHVIALANQHLLLKIKCASARTLPRLARQADATTDTIEREWIALTGGCLSCTGTLALHQAV
jgi:LPS sulfotransferase NodH